MVAGAEKVKTMDADLRCVQRKLASLAIQSEGKCGLGSAASSRSSSTSSVPELASEASVASASSYYPSASEQVDKSSLSSPSSIKSRELPHEEHLDHHDVSLVWRNEDGKEPGPHRIYIGSEKMSRYRKALDKFGIRTIVNCTRGAENKYRDDPEFKYLKVELSDDNCEVLLDKLPAATRYIENDGDGEIVLIHCSKGVSRSVSVFIAWLIAYRGMSLRDSLALVKERRSLSNPNMGFIKQLMTYEKEQLGRTSLSMDDFLPCPVCLQVNFDSDYFSCGHRCCRSCLLKFPEGAKCAHCAYRDSEEEEEDETELNAHDHVQTRMRKRSKSIEDLSSWRTALPPPQPCASPPPMAD